LGRAAGFAELLAALKVFSAELDAGGLLSAKPPVAAAEEEEEEAGHLRRQEKGRGPFWHGPDLGAVDVALAPWAVRYHALEHYRGPAFRLPLEDPELAGYARWLDATTSHPSVAPTIPDKQRYLDHVSKYADGSAKSKVGDAVRSGRPAHELAIN